MPFYKFKNEHGTEYGSFEVFYGEQDANDLQPGWYWWPCFPGCLPDSDLGMPFGPFTTEQDAIQDAQDAQEEPK